MNTNIDPAFYISFSENQSFEKECKSLFSCFDLLDEGHTKSFEKFLNSPFLISNSRLSILYNALYEPYREKAYYIQGNNLLMKLFGRANLAKDQRRLKQDFKDLETSLYKFHAYKYLQEEPIEEYRLIVESFRNEGKPEAFSSALKSWKKMLKKLPLGDQYYLHHWLHAHYHYFAIDTPKTIKYHHVFERSKDYFNKLTDFMQLVYNHEDISWKQIFEEKDSQEESAIRQELNSSLIELYNLLLQLRGHPDFQHEEYQRIRGILLSQKGNVNPHHHFIIWQLMMNYLTNWNRKNNNQNPEELLFLLNYQIRNNLFVIFKQIPKELFLNNIKIALINDEIDLAKFILNEQGPKVVENDRLLATTHAEIAISFHQEEYQQVIDLLHEYFPHHQMDAYHDGLRLKSYRLRSALALVSKNWDYYEEYEQAFADFEKFLTRKKGILADGQYNYYQPFPNYIRRIYSTLNSKNMGKELTRIKKLLQKDPKVHAYHWINSFIDKLAKEI